MAAYERETAINNCSRRKTPIYDKYMIQESHNVTGNKVRPKIASKAGLNSHGLTLRQTA